MKKYFTPIFFTGVLLFISLQISAQSWAWAKSAGGPGSDAANAITTDEQGNVYITGNIAGFSNFSGTNYQGRGIYDVCVAKYDAQGNLLWVKLAGGNNNESGNSIKYKNGFLYICGNFSDTTWFSGNMLLSRGGQDAFLAKYDKDGNFIWVRQAGGVNDDNANSLDVDDAGNVFIAGTFRTAIALDTFHLSSTNFYDESFYAKYTSAGNVLWAKATKGNNTNQISGIAFDHDHSVFITGFFGASFKVGNATVNSSSSSYDIFLAKIDNNGNLDWLKKAGSPLEDAAHGICVDNNGNPSIVGYFAGTASFDSHTVTYSDYNDVFVARYDSAGNNLWVRAGRGHQLDVGWGIACDDNGNLFATGLFQDNIDFDGTVLHVNNFIDAFIISYTPGGNLRWAQQAGGMNTEVGFSLAVKNNGNVALCGYFSRTCNFGSIALDIAEVTDLFVAEFHQPLVNNISETENDFSFSMYPNPSSQFTVLSLPFTVEQPTTITVHDELGKKIFNEKIIAAYCQLPTAYWHAGIYFVQVSCTGKTVTKKLVIAR